MSACKTYLEDSVADAADAAEVADEVDEQPPGARHPRSRRLVALLVALFLLAITVLAAGFSLFRAPPLPDRTRPLPHVIPEQGAVR